MIKIEAQTLEEAYQNAASTLSCSVTQLKIEVVQNPSKGVFGLFKKTAIIVAAIDSTKIKEKKTYEEPQKREEAKVESTSAPKEKKVSQKRDSSSKPKPNKRVPNKTQKREQKVLNDTIMPQSFVNDQDDEDDELSNGLNYTADYDDEYDNNDEKNVNIAQIALNIQEEINVLFDLTCFKIDKIEVSVYDENTLLVEFRGDDAALLIGKEGYRYKALSYMIFNWINTKYDVQLRLEIAEFLKNQEESVSRYLVGVCENVAKDGRAQTKILDGVLVQIALKELRDKYPDKYVVIRSTRDGLKYIIVNDYHSN